MVQAVGTLVAPFGRTLVQNVHLYHEAKALSQLMTQELFEKFFVIAAEGNIYNPFVWLQNESSIYCHRIKNSTTVGTNCFNSMTIFFQNRCPTTDLHFLYVGILMLRPSY